MDPVKTRGDYWSARDIMHCLGYKKWVNFAGVIERAISITKHNHVGGRIIKTFAVVEIGSGAKRKIIDYLIDKEGLILLNELCSSFKLNNFYSMRNETIVLQLVEKYCFKKGIKFQYQYRLEKFIFDCKVGNHILIEFDEPHHQINTQQKEIDAKKTAIAKLNGFVMYRVSIEMDIIDIIIFLECELSR